MECVIYAFIFFQPPLASQLAASTRLLLRQIKSIVGKTIRSEIKEEEQRHYKIYWINGER